ncbi:hypothetical protein P4126_31755 [Pseudomonas aeruginosa]|nr:hypothetical protein [Pseudomonas aeruginosa]MDF5937095.1 hypothetical protein [Pseudomonas aeruginosa]MDF5940275.1 hypothetical protein [Pseudomonas aeruginosa]MDF5950313.1 hypothetical protein [Pseudomonas aeruginosa]
MLIDLLREEEPSIEFLPENLLVRGRNKLVWYTAPQVLEIPFRGEIIKAPIPGLIYLAGGVLRCYAYKGKSRPTPETELHFAPLGNTYNNGTFCSGNVNLPREILIENIPTWQRFVLESTNTHGGGVTPSRASRTSTSWCSSTATFPPSKRRSSLTVASSCRKSKASL